MYVIPKDITRVALFLSKPFPSLKMKDIFVTILMKVQSFGIQTALSTTTMQLSSFNLEQPLNFVNPEYFVTIFFLYILSPVPSVLNLLASVH